MKSKKIYRLVLSAALSALAIGISVIEAQIPSFIPIPGIKLGLANLVVLFALYALGAVDAAAVSFVRIGIVGLFQGTLPGVLYSVSGGVFSFITMLLLKKVFSVRHLWIVSVFGAVMHNFGQILAASLLMKSSYVFWYLPVLICSAIVTGVLIGLCESFLLSHFMKISPKIIKN